MGAMSDDAGEPELSGDTAAGSSVADEDLVAALLARRADAMGDLYGAYANRLYSYAMTIVRSPDRAADVTHDAIIVACERIGQLRDPAKLRPWLYSICRNLCLRDLRAAGRVVPLDQVLGDGADAPDESVDLDAGVAANGARELIEDALSGMSDADREILELGLRHQLDTRQLAPVLGISEANARARMARSRSQLEGAIAALLLFRQRRSGCEQLRLVAGADRFTPLVRKRIARHMGSCDLCRRERSRAVRAIAIAALPLLVAPAALKSMTLDKPQLAAASAPYDPLSPVAAIRFDAAGWPTQAVVGPMQAALGVVAGAAVIGAGLVLASGGLPGWQLDQPPTDAAAAASSSASPVAPPPGGAAEPASDPVRPVKKRRPPRPRPTAQSWSTWSWSGGSDSSSDSDSGHSYRPKRPTKAPAKPKPKPKPRPARPKPAPSSSASPTPTPSPSTPTPTPTPAPTPTTTPTPDYCWRYDPSAGPDYIPGGPPPECGP